MLSDLFQERNLTPAPSLGTTLATAKDGGADKEVKVADLWQLQPGSSSLQLRLFLMTLALCPLMILLTFGIQL